jgi:hypothetical protein
MSKHVVRFCALACLLMPALLVGIAEAQPAPPTSTPQVIVIYREEVRPGRAAAHGVNEAAWAAAYMKANAPQQWLGMTSVAGPTEAWFLSGYPSYEAFQASEDGIEGNAALSAESDRFSTQDADLVSRTSTIVAGYRPALSYQPEVKLPEMRYMQVDVVRVKAGHDRDFRAAWTQIAAAHTKAAMDEHWAVYEVDAGETDLTFYFFYPRKSLAEIDKSGPMHVADAYRDAVGENGRLEQREMFQRSIESSQTMIFKLRPAMSVLTKAWIDVDPGFWTVKPPVAVKAGAAVKK